MAQSLSQSATARANTSCIRAACEKLGIPYKTHDAYGNFLSVDLDKRYFFVNFSTPFNNGGIDRVCKDKEFAWRLLNDAINMPRTKGYFDPFPSGEGYAGYVTEKGYDAIAREVVKDFKMPVIIKMNTGSQGKNVFLCNNYEEVIAALTKIYDHESPTYDYVALAQEYVRPKKEYRVVVFRQEIVLAYEKDISNATFTGNLSPLHYENAVARHITDAGLIDCFRDFINPLFSAFDVEFAGLDIILDTDDKFSLLELNAQPGFSYFVRDNGPELLTAMYEKLLTGLKA